MNMKREICIWIIIASSIALGTMGCSSVRYTKMAKSAEKDSRWDYAVTYYEKAGKNSLFKKKAENLAKQAKRNAAYFYYREALYAVNYRADFLGDQENARNRIRKALIYKPKKQEYIELDVKISQNIENLNQSINMMLDHTKESIRHKEFLEAMSQCESVLYIDSNNLKANKMKEKIKDNGSEYYLNEALKHEKNKDFNTAKQLLEYSIELKTSQDAETALHKVSNKIRAESLFNSVRQKFIQGDYRTTLDNLRKMVVLDPANPTYRALLLKGLAQRVSECMDNDEDRLALDTIIEIKCVASKNDTILKSLNEIEDKLIQKIVKNAGNDLVNNLPGNALEAFVWLNQRHFLPERDRDLLEASMTDVMQNAVPSIDISPFSGNDEELKGIGEQLSNCFFGKISENATIKCLAYHNDDTRKDVKSDIRLNFGEPISDFSRYMGNLNGTSLIIKGTVDSFSFKHHIDKIRKEKKYLSHYEKVINPEYLAYLDSDHNGVDMPDVENDKLSALFLAIEVVTTIAAMIPPPKYIETPVFEHYVYTIEKHSVDTCMNYSFVLLDKKTGRLLLKKSFSEKLNLEDTFVPGSTKAGIAHDPLELESDYGIKQQLIDNSVMKGMVYVNGVLEKHHQTYLSKAKNEKENGHFSLAKEYSIMAAVLKAPLSSIADTLWTITKIDDIQLIEDQGKVCIEKSGEGMSPFENSDVLVKINTINVMNRDHAIRLLCHFQPGSLVEVVVERDSKIMENMIILNPVHSENHIASL